jgi:hypothetical protein
MACFVTFKERLLASAPRAAIGFTLSLVNAGFTSRFLGLADLLPKALAAVMSRFTAFIALTFVGTCAPCKKAAARRTLVRAGARLPLFLLGFALLLTNTLGTVVAVRAVTRLLTDIRFSAESHNASITSAMAIP